MTTPHKAMLIQARDALLSACGGRCNAEYNPCDYREVADALTAYIDAPEPEPVAWMNNKRDMTYFGHYNKDDLPLYAAAGAAPVPEGWRSAVAMAYGHLWHTNNEPMAPTPLRSEESASYAARKLLRDLMTTKERGEAINAVQKLLAAAPKERT